jgi:hypothetical protein
MKKNLTVAAALMAVLSSASVPMAAFASQTNQGVSLEQLEAQAKKLQIENRINSNKKSLSKKLVEMGLIEEYQANSFAAKFYDQSESALTVEVVVGASLIPLTAAILVKLVANPEGNNPGMGSAVLAAGTAIVILNSSFIYDQTLSSRHDFMAKLKTMSAEEIFNSYNSLKKDTSALVSVIANLEAQLK